MTDKLKEQGLVTFLRDYLSSGKDGEPPSLRKLLLGFGVIPVRLVASSSMSIQLSLTSSDSSDMD